jgi:hypothetical protein
LWEGDTKDQYQNDPWVSAATEFVKDPDLYILWNIRAYSEPTNRSVCTQFSEGFRSFMDAVDGLDRKVCSS